MPRRIASPPIACDRGAVCWSVTAIAILLAAGACSERPAATAPIDWAERSPPARRPAEADRTPAAPEASGGREPTEPVQPASPAQPVASSPPAGEPAGSSAGVASAGGAAAATDGAMNGGAGDGSGPAGGDPGGAESGPAPALPGRGPRRPALPAEQAAEFAKASLGRARTALRGGDAGAAADLALEAYDAVAPHAAASRQCGALCTDAGKLLESIARKQGRAADQPTRFD